MCSKVKATRTFRLFLKSGLILDLKNIFYIPFFLEIQFQFLDSITLLIVFCLMEIFLVI
jgi:hypothetical protein